MVTITIDIRHDEIDKGTHVDYKPEFMGLVILRITKIFDSYNELIPILNKFFEEKHYKEKWGLNKEE